MQIAVENHTGIAVHRNASMSLTATGLFSDTFFDPALRLENCTLHPCPPLPGPWMGRMYRLDGGALVLTAEGTLVLEAAQLALAQAEAADLAAQQLRDQERVAQKIEALWQAADRYTSGYISGMAIGILTIGVMSGKPKCLAVAAWSAAVWREYYLRKSRITSGSEDEHDFSMFGPIPYSVPEMEAEAFGP